MSAPPITVRPLRLHEAADARAFLELLDHYARDPMGGGQGLGSEARQHLVPRLREVPHFVAFLAEDADGHPVGLVNCFFGFSTFAARPLLNVHDIVVHRTARGRGIGQALLAAAEAHARAHGCCKLTLEVLGNNLTARAAYQRFGFAAYELDPAAGQALFLQKLLD